MAGPSLTHQTRYDPAHASSPIVEDVRYGLFRRLGLSGPEASVFNLLHSNFRCHKNEIFVATAYKL